jgi:hypothetical protein
MVDESQVEEDKREERLFSRHRIKIVILGSLAAIVLGLVLSSLITGVSPIETLFGRRKVESPDLGKQAYTKGTDPFIGIIKGEGIDKDRKVYYIEQAGGQISVVAKERVEVREPAKPR